MTDTVKMFDYWAFHNDGRVQFFQICQGEVMDYREYDRVEDAPIALMDERAWNPGFVVPIRELRYHGRSYVAPADSIQAKKRKQIAEDALNLPPSFRPAQEADKTYAQIYVLLVRLSDHPHLCPELGISPDQALSLARDTLDLQTEAQRLLRVETSHSARERYD